MRQLTQELMGLARSLVVEAAQARYEKNFGGPKCESCAGLKAGPGVLATCFQIKRCYYDNVKTADASPRQQRLIESLGRGPKRS